MRSRLFDFVRTALPIVTMAAIALAAQAGQRWSNH